MINKAKFFIILAFLVLILFPVFQVNFTNTTIKEEKQFQAIAKKSTPVTPNPIKKQTVIPIVEEKKTTSVPIINNLKPLAMLLLGVEKTSDEKFGRSDSIMLAFIQPKTKEVMLLSIPRDTYIEIPGHGFDKLNRSFQLGGPELTKQTIEKWLDLKIDEIASIDYENFEKMIDLIGGIEIDVDREMVHGEFVIQKGKQVLSGKQALHFVRFRKSVDGNHDSDYKRTERQRQVLSKLSSELTNFKSVKESFTLIRSLFRTVETTLSLQQIIRYGHHYANFSSDNITTLSIEGVGKRRKGLWYEVISEEELIKKKQLINEFMSTEDKE